MNHAKKKPRKKRSFLSEGERRRQEKEEQLKEEGRIIAKFLTEGTTQMDHEDEVLVIYISLLVQFSVGKLEEKELENPHRRRIIQIVRAHCKGPEYIKEEESRCLAAYVSQHLSEYLADLLAICVVRHA